MMKKGDFVYTYDADDDDKVRTIVSQNFATATLHTVELFLGLP